MHGVLLNSMCVFQIIRDIQLMGLVALLILLDLLVLTAWSLTDPVKCARSIGAVVKVVERDMSYSLSQQDSCSSLYSDLWHILLIVMKVKHATGRNTQINIREQIVAVSPEFVLVCHVKHVMNVMWLCCGLSRVACSCMGPTWLVSPAMSASPRSTSPPPS